MSTESISRRLKAIEAKVVPRMSPMKRMLVELPEFERLVSGFGLDFEEIKALPGALHFLPCSWKGSARQSPLAPDASVMNQYSPVKSKVIYATN